MAPTNTVVLEQQNRYRQPDGRYGDQPKQRPLLQGITQDRLNAIANGDMVAAGYTRHVPEDTTTWWATGAAIREWGATSDAGYPILDDSTYPTADDRRGPRIRYNNGHGFEIRMRSATAFRRMAADLDGGTFQTVVSATNEQGTAIMVPLWCTHTNGTWTVSGPRGGEGPNSERVAEAVSAVLEGRHPRLALTQIGDLQQARRSRIERARHSLETSTRLDTPVTETWISGVGVMNDDTILIAIPHKRKDDPVATTRHYGYRKQYANTAERAAFLRRLRGTTGPGVGKTYNAEIKLDETVERVAVRHCDACGMTHLADTDHACFKHKPRPRREETVDESKKRGWLTRLFRGGQQ